MGVGEVSPLGPCAFDAALSDLMADSKLAKRENNKLDAHFRSSLGLDLVHLAEYERAVPIRPSRSVNGRRGDREVDY